MRRNEKKQYSHYDNIRSKRESDSTSKALMAETFPNLGREIDIQIQETQTTQLGLHWDIINSQKLKAKIIFKTAREKIEVTYKGIPIKISEEFSTETFQARRKWDNIFKILKGKRLNQE